MEIIVEESRQEEGLGKPKSTDNTENQADVKKLGTIGSQNSSPRRDFPQRLKMISTGLRFKNESSSLNSSPSPRSVDQSPRLSNSSSGSPRIILNQVAGKLKKPDEKELENKDKREEQMLKDKKKFDIGKEPGHKKFGDHNYEMSYYAGAGDFDKIKDIILKNQYTQDDLITAVEVAEKCGHFKIAEYLKAFQDFF